MKRPLRLVFSLIITLGCTPAWAQMAPTNPYSLLKTTDGHEMPNRTALSPDGKIAALAGITEFKHSYWVRLYDTKSRHLLKEITAHQAPISYLLFSPDGKQLLTQDQDGGALISEMPLGREVKWLIQPKKGSGYNGECEADTFSAWSKDGKQLLSQPNLYNENPPAQRGWKIWDVSTGTSRVLAPITTWGQSATFDDKGNIVTAEVEKKQLLVRQFDSTDGHQISQANFEGSGARLSPDGRFLLSTLTYGRDTTSTATAEETISALWDVATHRKLATLSGAMWNGLFSGDGKTLITSDTNGNITLRDLTPGHYGAIRRELPHFAGGELDDIAISADANWIFSLDSSAPARLWNLREPLTPFRYPLKTMLKGFNSQQVREVAGGFRTAGVMGRLPSTRIEVQEMRDGTSQHWQVPLNDDHQFLDLLEIAPGGKYLAAYWRKENKLEIYDLDTKVLTSTWQAPKKLAGDFSSSAALSFSPDGSRFAEASGGGELKIRDVTGTILRQWDAAAGSLEKIEWSPDGACIATLSDGFLTLWDAKTGQEKKTLTQSDARWEFAWSPDSRTIAVTTGPKAEQYRLDQLLIVDAEKGEVARKIALPTNHPFLHLKFSPDGKIIGGIQDLSLHLFQVTDGSKVPAPNDDCPAFSFTWTAPSELAIETGNRLKIWNLGPECLAQKP